MLKNFKKYLTKCKTQVTNKQNNYKIKYSEKKCANSFYMGLTIYLHPLSSNSKPSEGFTIKDFNTSFQAL